MTTRELRDFFAAAALTGILANNDSSGSLVDLARDAFNQAEKMLEESERCAKAEYIKETTP